MKQEIRLFFTALMFYTRIPCPSNIDHNEDALNKATRYFSLIGWIVGGLSFLVFYLSSFLFDQSVAVILSLATGILITGAFHEDGFADVSHTIDSQLTFPVDGVIVIHGGKSPSTDGDARGRYSSHSAYHVTCVVRSS